MNIHPIAATPANRPTSGRRTRSQRIAFGGVVIAAASLLAACGASGGKTASDDADAKTTTTVAAGDVSSSTTVADPANSSSGTNSGSNAGNNSGSSSGGNTNSGNNSGGNTNSGNNSGGTSSGPAPTITSFQTPENVDCHNGNFQMFSASWSTQNATKTTISIDGPGVYKTYGPSGSDSLPFNCSSSHTFLLTAFSANGKTTTRSITLQPRNVQTPDTEPTDDADPMDPTTTTQP